MKRIMKFGNITRISVSPLEANIVLMVISNVIRRDHFSSPMKRLTERIIIMFIH